jgi:hypothetical protein
MAFSIDLSAAARRNLRAAITLHVADAPGAQPGCRAVAGYLFGLAGEIAIKQIMRHSHIVKLPDDQRNDDPYRVHFPALKTLLSRKIQGRRAGELRKIVDDPRLFQHWNTDMRYAPGSEIRDEWVASWKASAERLVAQMDAR